MSSVTVDQVKDINLTLLNKQITDTKAKSIAKRLNNNKITLQLYLVELFLSPDFIKTSLEKVMDFHLLFAHHARLLLVSSLLPPAERILDLGGANGSIYEMGYPHKFNEITIVDLPPEQRDPMYKDLVVKKTVTPNGKIGVHFGDMCNLDLADNDSIDLVWSGESIEHVDEAAGIQMIEEAFRVLRPGGSFCLDTPNRIITKLHTEWSGGGFIHPEHKLEYYPEQLEAALTAAGFVIIEKKGVRHMPRTYSTGVFDYSDYVLGSPLSDDVNASYMMYFHCIKPIPTPRLSLTKRASRKARMKVSQLLKN